MNPQPPEYIGHFFATLFFIIVLFHVIKAFTNTNEMHNSDIFVIGYVEDSVNQVNNIYIKESIKLESQQLFIDCVDALKALGMKKNEAMRKARNIFTTQEFKPQTVQEFLLIALNKS